MRFPSLIFLCCAPITAAIEMSHYGHSWPWAGLFQLAVGAVLGWLDTRTES